MSSVKSMEDWSSQTVTFPLNNGIFENLNKTKIDIKIDNAKKKGNNMWRNSVNDISYEIDGDMVKFKVEGMNAFGIIHACLFLANGTLPNLVRKFDCHPNHIQYGSPCSHRCCAINGCYDWNWKKISNLT